MSRRPRPSRARRQSPRRHAGGEGLGRVLIVECDYDRLAENRQTFAPELDKLLAKLIPSDAKCFIRARTKRELLAGFGIAAADGASFDVVVLVGHSNRNGMTLAADLKSPWPGVAQWFEHFHPRVMVLVACEAGRWLPCRALFDAIPSLREIYGSPLQVNDMQARALQLLVPYALWGGQIRSDVLVLLQGVVFSATHGLILRRTRREFMSAGADDGVVWTGLEDMAGLIIANLPGQVRGR